MQPKSSGSCVHCSAAVQRFLQTRPTPCSLLIMHSRVAQKSYGSEHR